MARSTQIKTALLYLCLLSIPGCLDVSGPDTGTQSVLIGGGAAPSLTVVNPLTNRIDGYIRGLPPSKGPMGIDTSRHVLFTLANDGRAPQELVEVDLQLRTVIRQVDVASMTPPPSASHFQVAGAYLVFPTADGRSVLIDGVDGSVRALGVVDQSTFQVREVIGSISVALDGAARFLTGPAAGEIGIVGRRVTNNAVPDQVFLLDPTGYTIVDSIPVSAPYVGPYPDALQVLPSPDGGRIYVVTPTSITCFDVQTHAITSSASIGAPRPALSISSDGTRLYETDGTSGDDPGSGVISVFDAGLRSLTPIDLRPYSATGLPPVLVKSAVSADGSRLFVSSGTGEIAFVDPQPAQVFVIHLAGTLIVSQIPLHDWGPSGVFVF